MKLKKTRTLNILLAIAMLISLLPTLGGVVSAAPIDLNRPACYTAEEGNIARLPSVRQLTNATEARYNPLTGEGVDRAGINANFCNNS